MLGPAASLFFKSLLATLGLFFLSFQVLKAAPVPTRHSTTEKKPEATGSWNLLLSNKQPSPFLDCSGDTQNRCTFNNLSLLSQSFSALYGQETTPALLVRFFEGYLKNGDENRQKMLNDLKSLTSVPKQTLFQLELWILKDFVTSHPQSPNSPDDLALFALAGLRWNALHRMQGSQPSFKLPLDFFKGFGDSLARDNLPSSTNPQLKKFVEKAKQGDSLGSFNNAELSQFRDLLLTLYLEDSRSETMRYMAYAVSLIDSELDLRLFESDRQSLVSLLAKMPEQHVLPFKSALRSLEPHEKAALQFIQSSAHGVPTEGRRRLLEERTSSLLPSLQALLKAYPTDADLNRLVQSYSPDRLLSWLEKKYPPVSENIQIPILAALSGLNPTVFEGRSAKDIVKESELRHQTLSALAAIEANSESLSKFPSIIKAARLLAKKITDENQPLLLGNDEKDEHYTDRNLDLSKPVNIYDFGDFVSYVKKATSDQKFGTPLIFQLPPEERKKVDALIESLTTLSEQSVPKEKIKLPVNLQFLHQDRQGLDRIVSHLKKSTLSIQPENPAFERLPERFFHEHVENEETWPSEPALSVLGGSLAGLPVASIPEWHQILSRNDDRIRQWLAQIQSNTDADVSRLSKDPRFSALLSHQLGPEFARNFRSRTGTLDPTLQKKLREAILGAHQDHLLSLSEEGLLSLASGSQQDKDRVGQYLEKIVNSAPLSSLILGSAGNKNEKIRLGIEVALATKISKLLAKNQVEEAVLSNLIMKHLFSPFPKLSLETLCAIATDTGSDQNKAKEFLAEIIKKNSSFSSTQFANLSLEQTLNLALLSRTLEAPVINRLGINASSKDVATRILLGVKEAPFSGPEKLFLMARALPAHEVNIQDRESTYHSLPEAFYALATQPPSQRGSPEAKSSASLHEAVRDQVQTLLKKHKSDSKHLASEEVAFLHTLGYLDQKNYRSVDDIATSPDESRDEIINQVNQRLRIFHDPLLSQTERELLKKLDITPLFGGSTPSDFLYKHKDALVIIFHQYLQLHRHAPKNIQEQAKNLINQKRQNMDPDEKLFAITVDLLKLTSTYHRLKLLEPSEPKYLKDALMANQEILNALLRRLEKEDFSYRELIELFDRGHYFAQQMGSSLEEWLKRRYPDFQRSPHLFANQAPKEVKELITSLLQNELMLLKPQLATADSKKFKEFLKTFAIAQKTWPADKPYAGTGFVKYLNEQLQQKKITEDQYRQLMATPLARTYNPFAPAVVAGIDRLLPDPPALPDPKLDLKKIAKGSHLLMFVDEIPDLTLPEEDRRVLASKKHLDTTNQLLSEGSSLSVPKTELDHYYQRRKSHLADEIPRLEREITQKKKLNNSPAESLHIAKLEQSLGHKRAELSRLNETLFTRSCEPKLDPARNIKLKVKTTFWGNEVPWEVPFNIVKDRNTDLLTAMVQDYLASPDRRKSVAPFTSKINIREPYFTRSLNNLLTGVMLKGRSQEDIDLFGSDHADLTEEQEKRKKEIMDERKPFFQDVLLDYASKIPAAKAECERVRNQSLSAYKEVATACWRVHFFEQYLEQIFSIDEMFELKLTEEAGLIPVKFTSELEHEHRSTKKVYDFSSPTPLPEYFHKMLKDVSQNKEKAANYETYLEVFARQAPGNDQLLLALFTPVPSTSPLYPLKLLVWKHAFPPEYQEFFNNSPDNAEFKARFDQTAPSMCKELWDLKSRTPELAKKNRDAKMELLRSVNLLFKPEKDFQVGRGRTKADEVIQEGNPLKSKGLEEGALERFAHLAEPVTPDILKQRKAHPPSFGDLIKDRTRQRLEERAEKLAEVKKSLEDYFKRVADGRSIPTKLWRGVVQSDFMRDLKELISLLDKLKNEKSEQLPGTLLRIHELQEKLASKVEPVADKRLFAALARQIDYITDKQHDKKQHYTRDIPETLSTLSDLQYRINQALLPLTAYPERQWLEPSAKADPRLTALLALQSDTLSNADKERLVLRGLQKYLDETKAKFKDHPEIKAKIQDLEDLSEKVSKKLLSDSPPSLQTLHELTSEFQRRAIDLLRLTRQEKARQNVLHLLSHNATRSPALAGLIAELEQNKKDPLTTITRIQEAAEQTLSELKLHAQGEPGLYHADYLEPRKKEAGSTTPPCVWQGIAPSACHQHLKDDKRKAKAITQLEEFLTNCQESSARSHELSAQADQELKFKIDPPKTEKTLGGEVRKTDFSGSYKFARIYQGVKTNDISPLHAALPRESFLALNELHPADLDALNFLVGSNVSYLPGFHAGDKFSCELLIKAAVEKTDETLLYLYYPNKIEPNGAWTPPTLRLPFPFTETGFDPAFKQTLQQRRKLARGNSEYSYADGEYIHHLFYTRNSDYQQLKDAAYTKRALTELILNPNPTAIYKAIWGSEHLRTNFIHHLENSLRLSEADKDTLNQLPFSDKDWKKTLNRLATLSEKQAEELSHYLKEKLNHKPPASCEVQQVWMLAAQLNHELHEDAKENLFTCEQRELGRHRYDLADLNKRILPAGSTPPQQPTAVAPPPRLVTPKQTVPSTPRDSARPSFFENSKKGFVEAARWVQDRFGALKGFAERLTEDPTLLKMPPAPTDEALLKKATSRRNDYFKHVLAFRPMEQVFLTPGWDYSLREFLKQHPAKEGVIEDIKSWLPLYVRSHVSDTKLPKDIFKGKKFGQLDMEKLPPHLKKELEELAARMHHYQRNIDAVHPPKDWQKKYDDLFKQDPRFIEQLDQLEHLVCKQLPAITHNDEACQDLEEALRILNKEEIVALMRKYNPEGRFYDLIHTQPDAALKTISEKLFQGIPLSNEDVVQLAFLSKDQKKWEVLLRERRLRPGFSSADDLEKSDKQLRELDLPSWEHELLFSSSTPQGMEIFRQRYEKFKRDIAQVEGIEKQALQDASPLFHAMHQQEVALQIQNVKKALGDFKKQNEKHLTYQVDGKTETLRLTPHLLHALEKYDKLCVNNFPDNYFPDEHSLNIEAQQKFINEECRELKDKEDLKQKLKKLTGQLRHSGALEVDFQKDPALANTRMLLNAAFTEDYLENKLCKKDPKGLQQVLDASQDIWGQWKKLTGGAEQTYQRNTQRVADCMREHNQKRKAKERTFALELGRLNRELSTYKLRVADYEKALETAERMIIFYLPRNEREAELKKKYPAEPTKWLPRKHTMEDIVSKNDEITSSERERGTENQKQLKAVVTSQLQKAKDRYAALNRQYTPTLKKIADEKSKLDSTYEKQFNVCKKGLEPQVLPSQGEFIATELEKRFGHYLDKNNPLFEANQAVFTAQVGFTGKMLQLSQQGDELAKFLSKQPNILEQLESNPLYQDFVRKVNSSVCGSARTRLINQLKESLQDEHRKEKAYSDELTKIFKRLKEVWNISYDGESISFLEARLYAGDKNELMSLLKRLGELQLKNKLKEISQTPGHPLSGILNDIKDFNLLDQLLPEEILKDKLFNLYASLGGLSWQKANAFSAAFVKPVTKGDETEIEFEFSPLSKLTSLVQSLKERLDKEMTKHSEYQQKFRDYEDEYALFKKSTYVNADKFVPFLPHYSHMEDAQSAEEYDWNTHNKEVARMVVALQNLGGIPFAQDGVLVGSAKDLGDSLETQHFAQFQLDQQKVVADIISDGNARLRQTIIEGSLVVIPYVGQARLAALAARAGMSASRAARIGKAGYGLLTGARQGVGFHYGVSQMGQRVAGLAGRGDGLVRAGQGEVDAYFTNLMFGLNGPIAELIATPTGAIGNITSRVLYPNATRASQAIRAQTISQQLGGWAGMFGGSMISESAKHYFVNGMDASEAVSRAFLPSVRMSFLAAPHFVFSPYNRFLYGAEAGAKLLAYDLAFAMPRDWNRDLWDPHELEQLEDKFHADALKLLEKKKNQGILKKSYESKSRKDQTLSFDADYQAALAEARHNHLVDHIVTNLVMYGEASGKAAINAPKAAHAATLARLGEVASREAAQYLNIPVGTVIAPSHFVQKRIRERRDAPRSIRPTFLYLRQGSRDEARRRARLTEAERRNEDEQAACEEATAEIFGTMTRATLRNLLSDPASSADLARTLGIDETILREAFRSAYGVDITDPNAVRTFQEANPNEEAYQVATQAGRLISELERMLTNSVRNRLASWNRLKTKNNFSSSPFQFMMDHNTEADTARTEATRLVEQLLNVDRLRVAFPRSPIPPIHIDFDQSLPIELFEAGNAVHQRAADIEVARFVASNPAVVPHPTSIDWSGLPQFIEQSIHQQAPVFTGRRPARTVTYQQLVQEYYLGRASRRFP